ncbi:NUDIX hydrolase, core domain protein [mine drainage metagenome]|uniref:NUDIX hydrolase, core domain protein n=1 Tax=mine drainage metagenome TaxID=410659 RepID=T0ZHX0_9ZZZZ
MANSNVKKELSCGAILYTLHNGSVKILLLEQDNAHYNRTGEEAKKRVIDIGPSGHINSSEKEEDAARREIYEETGLDGLSFDKGFRYDMKYEFDAEYDGKEVHIVKTRRYWCARIPDSLVDKIHISAEHKRYWMADINDAMSMEYIEDSKKELLQHFYAHISKDVKRR